MKRLFSASVRSIFQGLIGLCLLGVSLSACASSAPSGPSATTAPLAVSPASTQAVVSDQTPVGNSSAKTSPTNAPATATAEPAAAVINGNIIITLATLDRETNRRLDARKSIGDPMPADAKAFRDTVLDSLIEQALIEYAAQQQKIVVTDQEVDNEIQDYVKAAGSKDKWLTQIASDHMSEAEYRVALKSALITTKMRDIVTAKIGSTAEQVHSRHILVADQTSAAQILQQLQGGADFAKLAAQFSLDLTTKQTGGDLGWFTRGQLLQQSVEDAAFSLPINQYSVPIKSDLGYHIVQTLEHVKDRPIDGYTRSRLAQDTFEQWLQTLVKSAHIEKYPRP